MPDTTYMTLDRADVLTYMGPNYPPRPGTPCLILPDEAGVTDGAVGVYPEEGRPGYMWWVLDGVVYVQGAGTPNEELAALIPGSVLDTVPDPNPAPDSPPMS